MEYTIIDAHTYLGLVSKVNEAIKKGWKPQGGVSGGDWFYQAMVKQN
jgi:hypothetical protein